MSTTDYANQEALNKALNIYRTCMRGFIIFHLQKIPGTNVEDVVIDSVSDWRADEIERKLNEGMDIKSIIDIDDFPLLVVGERGINWKEVFKGPLNDDKDFQNQLWLIKTCRDQSWAHPPEGDAESEGARAYLFLIAEVLRKIKRSDKRCEVEAIRDELFFDDTPEHLERAEEHLESVKAENAEYKRSLAEAEERSEAAEAEKSKYEKENSALSEQVAEKEKQRKKLDRQVKNAKTGNDKLKKELASTKKRLEKFEAAQADYKNRLETTSKELKGTNAERKEIEERLATALNQLAAAQAAEKGVAARLRALQSLFTAAAIGEQEVQEVFQRVYPPIETDSAVRILDRRDVDKKNYLLELMEQKQPTLIYVQSEEMVDLLLERVLPEKADLIEKHGEQTSETEEMEILKRLENAELVAVVSDTTFSTMARSHCVEHFVFCHLVPSLDVFFKRCEPAFTSEKNAYLHLIYNTEQDIEGLNQWLTQKYPDAEALGRLYRELKELAETNGNFIKPENVYDAGIYSKLGMAKLGIETGLAIFEELQFLEQNKDGVKFLPDPEKQGLDESKIHCGGEELRRGIAEVQAFQLEQRIKNIWEEIQEKLDVDSEQILREDSIDEVYPSVSEIQSDQQRTETVENDSESDDADIEANQAPKPPRANAMVPEEQFREIQSRSAAGESNSELAKEFDLSSTAIRFVAETTEGTRNEIAVKVVELRINKEGLRPIAWKKIREKLGLHNDHFHQVIRHSEGYLNAVIERIKSLKFADGGWEYNGKLSVLTGIEDIENYLESVKRRKTWKDVE